MTWAMSFGDLVFDAQAHDENWRMHWKHTMYSPRGAGFHAASGSSVSVLWRMTSYEFVFWFEGACACSIFVICAADDRVQLTQL